MSVSGRTIQIHVGAGSDAATADVLLVGYLLEATTPIGRDENSGGSVRRSRRDPWCGGTIDSVTAQYRAVSISKQEYKRIVPSQVDFADSDEDAINNSLSRSSSHAQQT